MPDTDLLVHLALCTLEDAKAQAAHGPIARSWGQRLALTVISRTGRVKDFQIRDFWNALADPMSWAKTDVYSRGHRDQVLSACLSQYYYAFGIEEPCITKRKEWAKRYAPEGGGEPETLPPLAPL